MRREPDNAQVIDDEENKEDDMNVKNPSGVGYVAIAIVIGLAPQILSRWLDGIDKAPVQIALAQLQTQVANLTLQVTKLTDQPYVRRDDFENRLAGFDRRIGEVERHQQPSR
jgi:hypothetical protein